jgi:hypothetical protein
MNNLKDRYIKLFPKKGISYSSILKIEKRLSIKLPQDLVDILDYYCGYSDIAKLSLFSFVEEGNSWNVCDQTEHFREIIKLPPEYLVLKEGDESFIVLKTSSNPKVPSPVIWLSSVDVLNLIEGNQLLDNPIFFPTFADFFKFLLDEEEKMRAEDMK